MDLAEVRQRHKRGSTDSKCTGLAVELVADGHRALVGYLHKKDRDGRLGSGSHAARCGSTFAEPSPHTSPSRETQHTFTAFVMAPRRAACEPLYAERRRVCFSADDARQYDSLRVANQSFSCRLPFNRPGVHDAVRGSTPPLLPPILIPRPLQTCEEGSHHTATPLIVWRSRWPHNFMEFISRVLVAAPWLLEAAQHSASVSVLVPGMPSGLPSFYGSIFGAIGAQIGSNASAMLRGREVVAPTFCCVNSVVDLNLSAIERLLTRIRHHHLGDRWGQAPKPWPSRWLVRDAGNAHDPVSSAKIALIFRGGETTAKGGRAFASRAIATADSLLDACSHRAASCTRIKFPPADTFSNALRLLLDVSVLVGMHGAGLANAVFMRAHSVVVEVLPEGFAQPGSFAITPDKYGWLNDLGLRRVRVVAQERSPLCATPSERQHKVWERLRDCDVIISWPQIENALG